MTTRDGDTFVHTVLVGLSPYPAYYAHMTPINEAGGVTWDVQPPRHSDPDELREQAAAGEWAIDLRARTTFT